MSNGLEQEHANSLIALE